MIGGAGFLGSSFLRNINEQENEVYPCDVNEVNHKNFIFMDISKPETMKSLMNADIILNLAAVHRDDIKPISKYDDVNVKGAKNICDAATQYNVNKIIFISSVAIYGLPPKIQMRKVKQITSMIMEEQNILQNKYSKSGNLKILMKEAWLLFAQP